MKKSLCLLLFPLLPLCGGELLRNGGFEKPGITDFRFGRISKSPLRQVERSSAKAKSGNWSLRSFSADPQSGPSVELPRLLTVPGKKYKFSFAFFVISREAEAKVSARIAFLNKSGKVIRYMFPVFKNTPGEWHTPEVTFFPPVDCAYTGITLWVNGRQTIHFDDFSLAAIEEKETPDIHAGALSLQDTATCTIWKEAPYLKVPAAGVPAGLKKGGSVTLSAAANESEPFQIIISPKKNLAGVTLSFSALKGKGHQLPASVFSWKKVGFINLKNPDNPAMKGLNADPLFPEVRSAAVKGKNLPFFVRVNVPPRTPAGIYTGEFQVLDGSGSLGRFGIKLRVYDFELPQIPHLKTYFYARPFPAYNMWDKRTFDQKAENFHKIMHEHRMTGNQAIFPPNPKWHIRNGKLTITDWSTFDKEVERRHKLYGQTNFPVPTWTARGFSGGWAYTGGSGDKPGKSPYGPFNLVSPEGLKYAGQYAAEFAKHVEKKFPHLNFFAYIFDEPPAKVYADLKKLLDAIHAAAPSFKVFIPKNVSDDIGHVHTFCVPLAQGYIDMARHREHQKKGGRIWYYNWRVNLGNHGYISNRLYPWQVYSAEGSGALLWGTIHTNMGINPWTDLDRTYNCGAATIFYPPRRPEEGNIPSQRAAMIREGIDDFDYMQILEKHIDSHYPGAGRLRVMEIVKELIPVPPFKFVNDPHLLARVREELALETEAFKHLPVTLLSHPVPNSRTELAAVKFKLLAPAGAKVTIDGKVYGTVQGKSPWKSP